MLQNNISTQSIYHVKFIYYIFKRYSIFEILRKVCTPWSAFRRISLVIDARSPIKQLSPNHLPSWGENCLMSSQPLVVQITIFIACNWFKMDKKWIILSNLNFIIYIFRYLFISFFCRKIYWPALNITCSFYYSFFLCFTRFCFFFKNHFCLVVRGVLPLSGPTTIKTFFMCLLLGGHHYLDHLRAGLHHRGSQRPRWGHAVHGVSWDHRPSLNRPPSSRYHRHSYGRPQNFL